MGRPPTATVTIATPKRLLDAAQAEFAAAGFARAKLADIAARAGITRPSLLYHFGSKEELYRACVERSFGRLANALATVMLAPKPFLVRLRATIVAYAEFLGAEPEIARIVLRELIDGSGPGADILVKQVAPLVDGVEAFVRSQGVEALRPGVPVRAAIMQIAGDMLLRVAAGPLRAPLWGPRDHTLELAMTLLLTDETGGS